MAGYAYLCLRTFCITDDGVKRRYLILYLNIDPDYLSCYLCSLPLMLSKDLECGQLTIEDLWTISGVTPFPESMGFPEVAIAAISDGSFRLLLLP